MDGAYPASGVIPTPHFLKRPKLKEFFSDLGLSFTTLDSGVHPWSPVANANMFFFRLICDSGATSRRFCASILYPCVRSFIRESLLFLVFSQLANLLFLDDTLPAFFSSCGFRF